MTLSNAAIDLKMMQVAALLDSDSAAAATQAEALLETCPDRHDVMLLLATAYRQSGRASAAFAVLSRLATQRPEAAVIHLELGRAARAIGRDVDARRALEHSVAVQPDLADAWRALSQIDAAQGDALACDRAYAKFFQLTKDSQRLREAGTALADRRYETAQLLLRRRVSEAPDDVEAKRLLAQVAYEREDFASAERLLEDCLSCEPGYSQARLELVVVLLAQQKPAPAVVLLDRLQALEPQNFSYRSLRASALTMLGQSQQSLEIYSDLLKEYPNQVGVWLTYGHALRTSGQTAQAISAYRKSIEISPDYGEAYFSLANLKTFQFTCADIAAMRAQLARTDISDDARWHFEFALGKANEDAQSYAESFAHYARGNELRRAAIFYDADWITSQVNRTCALFTKEFFETRGDWGCDVKDPIFIVGLPRSGSTLLEQILASHSQVEGTRELPDVPAFALQLGAGNLRPGEVGYPESVGLLDREQLRRYGERYIEQTRPYRSAAIPNFIDKMPNNFLYIGLIQLMLPRCRIIDARRHPLACGFSNFKQHFQKGLLFSYSLEEIGRFYRNYVTLMAHFDRVLPGRVHRVHYEHLIQDPEGETRRLLDYCGLPFEGSCLRFHENRRVVQTASSEQVRRPIYSESLDQWRHFEPWLGPLKDALGDLVSSYPAARA